MSNEKMRADFEAWAIREGKAYRSEQMGVRFHNAADGHPSWVAWQAALAKQPQADEVMDAQRDAVARAICMACEDHPDSTGDSNIGGNRNEFRWQDYRDVADAAIKTMQETT